jgi:hypothetical protein
MAASGEKPVSVDIPAQEPGKPSPIGAGSFHADLGHLTEAFKPADQCLVAGSIGIERLGANQSAQWVKSSGNVLIEVGIDTTRDARGSFYDGHGHPFLLKWLRGGTAVLDRSDGRSGLLQQS